MDRAMYDLVTIGEVLLRLAVPSPQRIETVRQLDVQIGGAEANVAAAAARLGARVAWISALPDNLWGERVWRELAGHGVDCDGVRMLPDTRLGAYYLEYGVAPRPIRVLYDRRDSAFSRLGPDEVDWAPVREARIVHLSGITPALGAASRALIERAVAETGELSFDLNYRATLWSPADARAFVSSVLPKTRYFYIGAEEARVVFGFDGAPEAQLEALARLAPKATISLMQGADGCTVLDGGRVLRPRRRHDVQVVDPIGAGDAYVGGFLWATLRGGSVEDAVEAGQAVAALKCSMWGDIALVSLRDVEELLAGGPSVRR
jgi:2-dehydro-3-deoxygluconokinase